MQATIERLVPPKIFQDTIQEHLSCIRPMREAKPNISFEMTDSGKHIIHCYGHGGAGWTMLFGSIKRAIELFLEARPSKTDPVRIIGAGCMGLLAAAELARMGYRVAGITAKELVDLASWKAAGFFALMSLKTSAETKGLIESIGMATFLWYREIFQGLHPYIPSETIRWLPVYSLQGDDAGVEYLEKNGLIPPVEEVILDFGGGVRHENYLKYMTYFINGTLVMHGLKKEVARHGIVIDRKCVKSFDEFEEGWIFNCSGLGAQDLNDDKELIPVKGHLLTLKPSAGSGHMNYMLNTTVMQDGKRETLYLFPKTLSVSLSHPEGISCSGVLGGTFDVKDLDSPQWDEEQYRRIVQRACRFFYPHDHGF